jgi:hypothetical protein
MKPCNYLPQTYKICCLFEPWGHQGVLAPRLHVALAFSALGQPLLLRRTSRRTLDDVLYLWLVMIDVPTSVPRHQRRRDIGTRGAVSLMSSNYPRIIGACLLEAYATHQCLALASDVLSPRARQL